MGSLWREDMKSLGIEDIGCHAAKCANGAGPYEGMSGKRRADIQERLIIDIAASKLYGVVSVVDMVAYRSVKHILSRHLEPQDRQYNEPHILAVRQCAQQMCLMTEDATDEPIAFVVDRNQAFGKRAKAWYQVAVNNTTSVDRHRKRYGPYAEDDRMNAVGLQAADMIAYAGMRHAAGNPGWQWKKMMDGVRIGEPFKTGEKFWNEIAARFTTAAESGEPER